METLENKQIKRKKKEMYCIMDRKLRLYDERDNATTERQTTLQKEILDCEIAYDKVVRELRELNKVATPSTI